MSDFETDAGVRRWTAPLSPTLSPLSLGEGASRVAFLIMLLATRLHRWLGVGAFVYFVVVQIGSVQLGWHYAVDGYVSAVATGLIWWAVGRAIAWRAANAAAPASFAA